MSQNELIKNLFNPDSSERTIPIAQSSLKLPSIQLRRVTNMSNINGRQFKPVSMFAKNEND